MATVPSLSSFHQFDNLELIAGQVVEGFIIGLHKSPFHGFSVEFAEHRQYNAGDSVRDVDWKVYARTGKLFTKRFEEETNLRCQVIIDASSSMYFPEGEENNKMRFSVYAAAALMRLLKNQRDAFGLSIFSSDVEEHTKARSTSVHYKLVLSYLEQLLSNPSKNKKTAASDALHQIAENIPKRSLVVIFSDMMENVGNADELFSALQHLKYNKNEVILFDVQDKQKEVAFEFDNRPYVFVDMETGEKVKLRSNQVKEHYVKQMEENKKKLELHCHQYHIDLVEADINKDFSQVLIPYLTKRRKMM